MRVICESQLVAQLCPTLCDPMDCSPPDSSVHGISQARILEWVAIPFSRGSSQPRDWTQVSCIASRFFTLWATREAPFKPLYKSYITGYKFLFRYVICKYFLLFCDPWFHFLNGVFWSMKVFNFGKVQLIIFLSCLCVDDLLINHCLAWNPRFTLIFWEFMVLTLTCRSMIHFELSFAYDVW